MDLPAQLCLIGMASDKLRQLKKTYSLREFWCLGPLSPTPRTPAALPSCEPLTAYGTTALISLRVAVEYGAVALEKWIVLRRAWGCIVNYQVSDGAR